MRRRHPMYPVFAASLFSLFSLFFSAAPADAVDGVIEINQASALAGGITPSDTPGFPVTLDHPGAYRLTGNLTVPANTTAVRIEAENVRLDLGGFEVRGPNLCSGYPTNNCTTIGGAPGILSPTANQGLGVVRNGTVTGMGGPCIDLVGNSSTVEQVAVYHCGGTSGTIGSGIRLGLFGRAIGNHVSNTFGDGISLLSGGEARDNEARGNAFSGIISNGPRSALITGNMVYDNNSAGIVGGPLGGTLGLISRNVMSGNLGGPFVRAVSAGDNLCSGTLC